MMTLKEYRQEKGIRQDEVAKFLNVSRATYSRYESGKIKMTPDIVIRLSDFYNVSSDFIMGDIHYPITKNKFDTIKKLTNDEVNFILGSKELKDNRTLYQKQHELVELFNSLNIDELRKVIKIIRALQEE